MTAPRRAFGLLAGAATLVVAGAAVAHWTVGGAGSAQATGGATSPVTLTPGTPSAQLYPGGQASVTITVSNPNPGPVRIGSFALDTSQGTGGFAVDAAHAACPVSALSFTTQTGGWTVPGSGTLPVSLTNALSMSTGAANACQGATFTVYLTAAS